MAFYTNSYGPIVNVKTKSANGKKRKHGHKRKISAYTQLKPDYDIDQHIHIGSSKSLKDIRILIHVRLKDKSVEAIHSDTTAGYVAKIGTDYYVRYDLSALVFHFYRREKSKRKAFKNFLPSYGEDEG